MELYEEQGLIQLVHTGTRVKNLLDCIFSNSPNPQKIEVEINKCLTDHSMVYMDYVVTNNEEEKKGPTNLYLTKIPEYDLDQLDEAQNVKLRGKLLELIEVEREK